MTYFLTMLALTIALNILHFYLKKRRVDDVREVV